MTSLKIKPFTAIPRKRRLFIPNSWNILFSGGPNYLHKHCDKLHQELGPIFCEQLGQNELVFLADTQMIQTVIANEGLHPHHNVPEAWLLYNKVNNLERGLFFQVGEPWARLRRAFSKLLLANPTGVSKFSSQIYNISLQFIDNWLNKHQQQQGQNSNNNYVTINNIKSGLCNWSIESTGYVLFGQRMGCVSNGIEDSRAKKLVANVAKMFEETSKFQLIPCQIAQRFNLPAWNRFEISSTIMLAIANDYTEEFILKVKERKLDDNSNSLSIVNDLIQLNQLTDKEIARTMVDLIIAAADTTSNLVQWMLYILAKHKDVQMKIYNEIQPLLEGERLNQIDWQKFAQMTPYLSAFMKEISRLYPVAPFLARTLDHEIILDGYRIPAGKPIVFSLYTTSRMEEYFNQPLEFKPERWLRTEQQCRAKNSNAYASLPFGIGSRMCIGRRVAELEMSLLVAAFVMKCDSQLKAGDQDVEIKLKMILAPDRPINLCIKSR